MRSFLKMLILIVSITLVVGTTVGIYYLSSTAEFSRAGTIPQETESPADDGSLKTSGLETKGTSRAVPEN